MIKVKYNPITTLVEGNFLSGVNYPNVIIDEKSKTIDNHPYLEISKQDHALNLGKTMCVVNESYQEYVAPIEIRTSQARESLIYEIKLLKEDLLEKNIEFTMGIGNKSHTFILKNSDLIMLNALADTLSKNSVGNSSYKWTDKDGNRPSLNETSFRRLISHIVANDQAVNDLYFAAKDEINNKSLSNLDQFDLNKVFSR